MLNFTIYESDFLILFGVYVSFFATVFGIGRAISLLQDKGR